MAELSQSDREELSRVVGEALMSDQPAASLSTVEISGAKDFFCDNWPTIKGVLTFIGDQVGGFVRYAIKAVIVAGDLLHRRLCGG